MPEPFIPAWWARNPHLQTIFGSLRLRTFGRNEMVEAARETIVDPGNGTRLLGYHSRQVSEQAKGLIVLLHGWEGSVDSAYILSAGRFFYRHGYDVFRLNLRDHGQSHHMNKELFHGALTEEVFSAVESICRLMPGGDCFLVGFSLGGNFALRIALRHSQRPISQLKEVFCISPALSPYHSTLAIDTASPIYRHYFLNKWKRSLRKKQRCFPDLYHFDEILRHKTVMALTEAMMPYFPQFESCREYFSHYTLTGDALLPLTMPVTIFTSEDDPVVSAADFHRLPQNPYLRVSIQRYGGHCGFLDPFPFGSWCEREIVEIVEQVGR